MCLQLAKFQRVSIKEGTGFKIVRLTNRIDTYRPLFRYFLKDGKGGTNSPRFNPQRLVVKTSVEYIIGKTYKVKHSRIGRVYDRDGIRHPEWEYPAGVHMYKSLEIARQFARGTHRFLRGKHVILECRFGKAVAEDENVIVAMEVTPVRELPWD